MMTSDGQTISVLEEIFGEKVVARKWYIKKIIIWKIIGHKT
jgi:hypothetical protein